MVLGAVDYIAVFQKRKEDCKGLGVHHNCASEDCQRLHHPVQSAVNSQDAPIAALGAKVELLG